MVFPECLLKFNPCDILRILRGIAIVVPPFSNCSDKLVGCQEDSVSASGVDDFQLLVNLTKPIVGFERIFA